MKRRSPDPLEQWFRLLAWQVSQEFERLGYDLEQMGKEQAK